jgi:hypothetical protein
MLGETTSPTTQLLFGLALVIAGVVLALVRPNLDGVRSMRDWQLRTFPWLRRVPLAKHWYDDRNFDRLVRGMKFLGATWFIVIGLLVLLGVLEFR